MISHKHKTIFVHVPKVAGISIEQIFLEELNLDYQNRSALLMGVNTNLSIGPPRLSHLTAKEFIDLHFISDDLYKEYFTFGWVRNPYDRVYSFYKYLGYQDLISYSTFVNFFLDKLINDKSLYYFVQPMYNYLYIDDKLSVDYVGHLESINEDIKYVLKKLELPERRVPHMNNSEKIGLLLKTKRYFRIVKKYPSILLKLSFSSKKKTNALTQTMKDSIIGIYGKDFLTFNYKH